jgi:6-phosphofructokinase 1
MKRIALLTSGGDAPGMNAAIRAVVRCGFAEGWQVFGVRNGYAGLVAGHYVPLGPRDVAGIIQRGGTMLGSARCEEFTTEEGRARALGVIRRLGLDVVIVIGGNGSQTGAHLLAQAGVAVVGIASTIDNDLYGSEITIGVDTALNIALEAIDRLKVTASSHRRAFLVEVMGRDCGYLALMTAIAGGAEAAVIPERDTDPEALASQIRAAYERRMRSVRAMRSWSSPKEHDRMPPPWCRISPRMSSDSGSSCERPLQATYSGEARPRRSIDCWRHGWAPKQSRALPAARRVCSWAGNPAARP